MIQKNLNSSLDKSSQLIQRTQETNTETGRILVVHIFLNAMRDVVNIIYF